MSDGQIKAGSARQLARSLRTNECSGCDAANAEIERLNEQVKRIVGQEDNLRDELNAAGVENIRLRDAGEAMFVVLTEPGMQDVDEWKDDKRKAETRWRSALPASEGGT